MSGIENEATKLLNTFASIDIAQLSKSTLLSNANYWSYAIETLLHAHLPLTIRNLITKTIIGYKAGLFVQRLLINDLDPTMFFDALFFSKELKDSPPVSMFPQNENNDLSNIEPLISLVFPHLDNSDIFNNQISQLSFLYTLSSLELIESVKKFKAINLIINESNIYYPNPMSALETLSSSTFSFFSFNLSRPSSLLGYFTIERIIYEISKIEYKKYLPLPEFIPSITNLYINDPKIGFSFIIPWLLYVRCPPFTFGPTLLPCSSLLFSLILTREFKQPESTFPEKITYSLTSHLIIEAENNIHHEGQFLETFIKLITLSPKLNSDSEIGTVLLCYPQLLIQLLEKFINASEIQVQEYSLSRSDFFNYLSGHPSFALILHNPLFLNLFSNDSLLAEWRQLLDIHIKFFNSANRSESFQGFIPSSKRCLAAFLFLCIHYNEFLFPKEGLILVLYQTYELLEEITNKEVELDRSLKLKVLVGKAFNPTFHPKFHASIPKEFNDFYTSFSDDRFALSSILFYEALCLLSKIDPDAITPDIVHHHSYICNHIQCYTDQYIGMSDFFKKKLEAARISSAFEYASQYLIESSNESSFNDDWMIIRGCLNMPEFLIYGKSILKSLFLIQKKEAFLECWNTMNKDPTNLDRLWSAEDVYNFSQEIIESRDIELVLNILTQFLTADEVKFKEPIFRSISTHIFTSPQNVKTLLTSFKHVPREVLSIIISNINEVPAYISDDSLNLLTILINNLPPQTGQYHVSIRSFIGDNTGKQEINIYSPVDIDDCCGLAKEQDMFYCITCQCNCCMACAYKCHRTHQLEYKGENNFQCECYTNNSQKKKCDFASNANRDPYFFIESNHLLRLFNLIISTSLEPPNIKEDFIDNMINMPVKEGFCITFNEISDSLIQFKSSLFGLVPAGLDWSRCRLSTTPIHLAAISPDETTLILSHSKKITVHQMSTYTQFGETFLPFSSVELISSPPIENSQENMNNDEIIQYQTEPASNEYGTIHPFLSGPPFHMKAIAVGLTAVSVLSVYDSGLITHSEIFSGFPFSSFWIDSNTIVVFSSTALIVYPMDCQPIIIKVPNITSACYVKYQNRMKFLMSSKDTLFVSDDINIPKIPIQNDKNVYLGCKLSSYSFDKLGPFVVSSFNSGELIFLSSCINGKFTFLLTRDIFGSSKSFQSISATIPNGPCSLHFQAAIQNDKEYILIFQQAITGSLVSISIPFPHQDTQMTIDAHGSYVMGEILLFKSFVSNLGVFSSNNHVFVINDIGQLNIISEKKQKFSILNYVPPPSFLKYVKTTDIETSSPLPCSGKIYVQPTNSKHHILMLRLSCSKAINSINFMGRTLVLPNINQFDLFLTPSEVAQKKPISIDFEKNTVETIQAYTNNIELNFDAMAEEYKVVQSDQWLWRALNLQDAPNIKNDQYLETGYFQLVELIMTRIIGSCKEENIKTLILNMYMYPKKADICRRLLQKINGNIPQLISEVIKKNFEKFDEEGKLLAWRDFSYLPENLQEITRPFMKSNSDEVNPFDILDEFSHV